MFGASERVVADGEDFWAFQVRAPFERERMRPQCVLKIFWLERVGRSNNWRLPNSAADIRFARVLSESGEPIILQRDSLTSGWDQTRGTVYSFEDDDFIAHLSELAEQFGNDARPNRPRQAEPLEEAWEEEEEREEGEEGEEAGDAVEEHEPMRDAAVTPAILRQAVAQGAEPVRRTSRRVPKPIDMYEPV